MICYDEGVHATRTTAPSYYHRILPELLALALPPLAYYLLVERFFRYWDMFWIYSDESFNLIKAWLVMHGYRAYQHFWSDQPPLLNYLLSGLFRITGPDVHASRLLILAISCLLIAAVGVYVRLAWGRLHALACMLLLPLLPSFVYLSVSTLVGQPSIALAMLSMLAIAAWHRQRRSLYLLVSAVLMACSLLTKLFTGFLLPVFGLGLVLAEAPAFWNSRQWLPALKPAITWCAALLVTLALIGAFTLSPEALPQLFGTHLQAANSDPDAPVMQLNTINYHLQPATFILGLSLVGSLFTLRQRRWLMLYPLAWMVSAFGVLQFVRPVWSHHQLLVTVPAAMLAGCAAGEAVQFLTHKDILQARKLRSALLPAAITLLLAIVLVQRVPPTLTLFRMPGSAAPEARQSFESKLMKRIQRYAPRTRWLLTDMPMFAFRAGLLTPPETAVITWKRVASGNLSEQELIAAVEKYQPEQVLLARFKFPLLRDYLQQDYFIDLEREDGTALYIRNDLRP